MDDLNGGAIGVFDSGIGGLTVMAALKRRLPEEQIIYLGDTARVPYGTKSPVTIQRYSLQVADFLLEQLRPGQSSSSGPTAPCQFSALSSQDAAVLRRPAAAELSVLSAPAPRSEAMRTKPASVPCGPRPA